MHLYSIPYERLGNWSQTDLAYIRQDPALSSFYTYPQQPEAVTEILRQRKKFPVDRALVLRALKSQYRKIGYTLPFTDEVWMEESTFTVTTAHQPVLLTGPLYHIYKIAGTIHLAQDWQAAHPGHKIIPVFVLGSEDHDWAEINHFHLYGKKLTWEREASGPGGRLSLDGLAEVINAVAEKTGQTEFGPELIQLLTTAHQRASSYGEFHQALLIALFQAHGLVVLNMDDPDLKRAFIPWMEKELREHFSYQHVTPVQEALSQAGYKPQAYCRPVNLFYLSPGVRERLEPVEGGVKRMDSETTLTDEAMIRELHQYPERFSPNVILRPLYQEFILPNLAYIGGGGEIAYWLERKKQFEAAGVHFPMLVRRNSMLLIDSSAAALMEKADLAWEDVLEDYDTIVKAYLLRNSQTDLSYTDELELLEKAYASLASKAKRLDPTLAQAIIAEQHKQVKQFDQLGSRLLRTEKQHQDTQLRQIQKVKDKLSPQGGLQERYDNFIAYYVTYGPEWIREMVTICDPMERQFTIVQLQR